MGSSKSANFWEAISTRSLKRGSSDTEYLTCDFTPFGALLADVDISSGVTKIKRYSYLEIDPALTEAEKKNAYLSFLTTLGVKSYPKIMISMAEGMTCRQLSVPEMPYEDLIKAIAWELKKKYFFNPDDNHLGYLAVMDVEGVEGQEKLYDIFYCEKKVAQTHLDFVQSLGLEIDSLIPAQAVLGAYAEKVEPTADSDLIVCEIYESIARIIVARNGKVMLSRNVILGQAGGGVTDAVLDKVAQEIKVTIDFYDNQKNSRPIEKVLFAGGGYDVVHLHDYMSKHLSIKVILPNLEAFVSESCTQADKEFILGHPGLFSSALGLPLVTEQTINLVPEDIKTKHRIKKNSYILNIGLIVLGAFFALIIIMSSIQIQWMKNRLVELRKQHDAISSKKELLQSMLADSRVRRSARKGNIPVRGLLKELSLRTPALATLKDIQYNRQGGTLKIMGEVAIDPSRDSMKTVDQYVTSLGESIFCSSAKKISAANDDQNSVLKFEISCEIKGFA